MNAVWNVRMNAYAAQLFPRPGPRRTTRRERSLTSKALPPRWKKHGSFGSDDRRMIAQDGAPAQGVPATPCGGEQIR
jgi:hypothetical protein